MAAKQMTLEVAVEILKRSYRHELADFAFGDSEISWTQEKVPGSEGVADAYDGSSGCSIVFVAQDGYEVTTFTDDAAKELIRFGRHGSFERNDAGGRYCDDWDD